MTPLANRTIAETLAGFATNFRHDDIPEPVRDMARHLILDGVGIALAAATFDFARRTAAAMASFEAGDIPVIGLPGRFALRDAAMINGVLIHGLDYDDTHLVGVVHATASCFPATLAGAIHHRRSGRDILAAYVLGMEVSARLGMVARGEMNQVGFHPTGVVAAFGTAVAVGWLGGLDAQQITMAQGIVLSMAAGTREYSTDNSGSKRLHAGWAAVCGLTAAALARQGFTGPRTAYEGRFGLYATHLGLTAPSLDLPAATAGLGSVWETTQVAVKPYPACQLSIACIDAAVALWREGVIDPASVVHVETVVPPHAVQIVCEPAAAKLVPASGYATQFSLPFCVANALIHGRFGLADMERFEDAAVRALAAKVSYRVDHHTNYPKHFSGEVIVTLADGRVLSHREDINRGAADRPVTPPEIREKFYQNATLAVSHDRADAICAAILGIEEALDARQLAETLAGTAA
jgi:2-methylcitrate dehydratase PrpD